VEYPKVDRDLHLLMLVHRQVEEARGLGVEEPRLEYRAEPPEVSVRVIGVGAVEEVRAGGYCYGGELIEGAGEYLRRLDERGYVRLAPGTGGGTGTVEITGEGLKKVRQRLAFESNLPRRLTMPEVSLIGGPRVGMVNLWRADWEGHVIRVRDRRYLGSNTNEPATEYLEIDGRPVHIGLRSLPEIEGPLPGYMHRFLKALDQRTSTASCGPRTARTRSTRPHRAHGAVSEGGLPHLRGRCDDRRRHRQAVPHLMLRGRCWAGISLSPSLRISV
jgi:hypothetical protein